MSSLDIAVLLFLIGSIEIYEHVVLVLLRSLDKCLILVEGEILTLGIFHQGEVLSAVVEVLLREDSVVDEELQVVPFLLIFLTVLSEDSLQTVCYLLCDIGRDLLNLTVALQIAAAYVQRNIWRVDDSMQQGKELRNDTFHLICYKHLITVELYLITL